MGSIGSIKRTASVASVSSFYSVRSFVPAQAAPYLELLSDRNILCFGLSVFFFHLANATVTPLLGQVIGLGVERTGMMWTSILILVNEGCAVVVSSFADWLSHQLGYKGLLLFGFCALPLRCLAIVAVSELAAANRYALAATQVLDSVGVGTLDVAMVIVTRSLTAGTGRFGVAGSAVVMMKQLGGSLSNLLGGVVADASYTLAFAACGAAALLPPLLVGLGFREPDP